MAEQPLLVLDNANAEVKYLCEELAVYTHGFDWFNVIGIDAFMIGIFGLISALIGGGFALYGSVLVNRKQFEWQAELKRVEEIYKPLYNDLMESPVGNSIIKYRRYQMWDDIMRKAYFLAIHDDVKKSMHELYVSIPAYEKQASKLYLEIQSQTNKIFLEETGSILSTDNFGELLLWGIDRDDSSDIERTLRNRGNYNQQTPEKKEQLCKRIIEEIPKMSSYVELEVRSKAWGDKEQQAINCFKSRIEKVEKKFKS